MPTEISESCRNSLSTDNMQLLSIGPSSGIETAHALSHQTSIIIATAPSKKSCKQHSSAAQHWFIFPSYFSLNTLTHLQCVDRCKYMPGESNHLFYSSCSRDVLVLSRGRADREKQTYTERHWDADFCFLSFRGLHASPLLPLLPQHRPNHMWLFEVTQNSTNAIKKKI